MRVSGEVRGEWCVCEKVSGEVRVMVRGEYEDWRSEMKSECE